MSGKKAARILSRAAAIVLAVWNVCVTAFTAAAVYAVDKTEARLFGYRLTTVSSDSMAGVCAQGDIAVSRETAAETLREGDIITFQSADPDRYGEVITHKIREVTLYEGQAAFTTYGVAAGTDDPYPVPAGRVLGQYRFRLPGMGRFYQFLKSSAGYVTLIFLPFLLLLLLLGTWFVHRVKRLRIARQAELAAERQKSERLREELEQLRRKMDGQKPPP